MSDETDPKRLTPIDEQRMPGAIRNFKGTAYWNMLLMGTIPEPHQRLKHAFHYFADQQSGVAKELSKLISDDEVVEVIDLLAVASDEGPMINENITMNIVNKISVRMQDNALWEKSSEKEWSLAWDDKANDFCLVPCQDDTPESE